MQAGAERAVTALASSQHGAFGIRQAAARGVTPKDRRVRVERGQWLEPIEGVLVVAGSPATWRQQLMIGVLSGSATISHRASAGLHHLDGFGDEVLEASVVRGRMPRLPGFILHRAARLDAADITVVDGIPTTNIARTLCDLGAVVSDDLVEQALDDALRRRYSQRWIEETLARLDRPGPSGTATLRRVLQKPDRDGNLPDSHFERLIERLVVAGGLPQPQRQHRALDLHGTLLGEIDVAWPDIKLGIEATSARWHSGPRRGRRDQLRDLRLTAESWVMLYPAWRDVLEPQQFLDSALRIYARLARQRPA